MDESGLLLVDKPAGWTSHQVVGRVRRLLGTRKVGHAGTLDPMATGVLVVGVNRATRLLGHLALHDKDYVATMRLGVSTVTDDAEGQIIDRVDASAVSDADIEAAMAAQRGDIEQVPTAVSAIKVDGKRSYVRVRAGEQVELKARPVHVDRFDATAVRRLEVDGTGVVDVDCLVTCSSGTYVRALARDVGALLGVGGHLTALRRTRVGPFVLPEHPIDLSDDAPRPTLVAMGVAARLVFPVIDLDEDQEAAVRVGRALEVPVPQDPTALLDPDGDLLALYRPDPDRAGWSRPVCVLV